MNLPVTVEKAIKRLQKAGFECYVVGGCVRDSFLGLTPHDWDLTTNALPEQIIAIFADERTILTGVEHGTVTVIFDTMPLEITTYRIDGEYRDHRHPESVHFVSDITEDLRRRDFTVNAMAWNPQTGLCDPFGGAADLQARTLRCVGSAEQRFDEDALRILRALRFASTYGFSIEDSTAKALFAYAPMLCNVAGERLQTELNKLVVGEHVGEVLRQYAPVLFPLLPELEKTQGVLQYNPHHDKDVLGHTIAALEASPAVLPVRLALLLHDCGKPYSFEWIREGFGHFPNHPAIGAEIAKRVLRRLKYDRRTIDTVCRLIQYHDNPVKDDDASIRRWLYRLGEQELRWLLDVKEGDCNGHALSMPSVRKEELELARQAITRVISEGQCISLSMLAVNGDDMLSLGVPAGESVGKALHWIFERVLDGELPNEREVLLSTIMQQKDLII